MRTLTVDDYQRVRLPEVAPRTKFACEKDAQGRITLTKLEPAKASAPKVRFEKRNGRTVAVSNRPSLSGSELTPRKFYGRNQWHV
jgi:hypothetical protein